MIQDQDSRVPKEAAKRVNDPILAPASITNVEDGLLLDEARRYKNMELRLGSH